MRGRGLLSGNDKPGPRRLALVLLIALNTFFLSGFLFHVGNRNMEYDDALPRKTLITFLGIQYDAENQSCIEQILNGYSAAHNDMLVSYEGIALNAYSRLLNQRLKKDDRADDVFMLPPDCLRPYQRRGRLADLSGLPALTAYRPEVLGQMQMGGRPYIATTSLGARGLFANLDLLARYGVSTPRNGKAFLAACETFRAQGITPISADREALKTVLTAVSLTPPGGPIRENAAAFLAALNASPDRLEQAVGKGFALLALLRDKGYICMEDVRGIGSVRFNGLFCSGGRPFMIGGTWLSPGLAQARLGFRFKVFPLPLGESAPVTVLSLDTPLAVSASSPHRPQAVQLVEYLTSPENIRRYADAQGLLSPLRDAPPPADAAVRPLTDSLREGNVIFRSDIRLAWPLQNGLEAGLDVFLSGGNAGEATAETMRTLHRERAE
ncbi:ABC transporter substrate-binding protein [uncultured Desulfovibrio sp.]|uniref:ABC transporter substrate-binding protein n=1 Tax=uncultured Desulfovibrio sp. TaxID=167968 RepID=UPI00267320DE|nr:ABC transporter substrate-binding protein [uncultured Desulfovibrio sp.]